MFKLKLSTLPVLLGVLLAGAGFAATFLRPDPVVDLQSFDKSGTLSSQPGDQAGPELFVFASVDCSFCRQLHPELGKLVGVRVTTIVLPAHSDEGRTLTAAVWCSADRERAWDSAMEQNGLAGRTDCDTSVLDRNRAAAKAAGLSVTPTLVRQDGAILTGYHTAAEITTWLHKQ